MRENNVELPIPAAKTKVIQAFFDSKANKVLPVVAYNKGRKGPICEWCYKFQEVGLKRCWNCGATLEGEGDTDRD